LDDIPEQKRELKESTPSGLSVLLLLSFVASFVTARAFATLNPTMVVVSGGIHFHHFWYGLAMVSAAGMLGIVYALPAYKRAYAVVFGLGAGLIGDEVGLLLTFGNYNSSLTVSFGLIAILLRDRRQVEIDIISLELHERTLLAGIVVMGLSSLAFADEQYPLGLATLVVGAAVAVAGYLWRQRTLREARAPLRAKPE